MNHALDIESVGAVLSIDRIAKYLDSLEQKTILIAIDGRSGSGKSTFAKYFAKELERYNITTAIIQTDNFYQKQENPLAKPELIPGYAYGYFWKKLRKQVVTPLKENMSAKYMLSDWVSGKKQGQQIIEANQTVIVEGVISTYAKIADLFDLRIWLSCPKKVRIKRIIGRGDFPEEELEDWQIIENAYVSRQNEQNNAHIVVDTSIDYENGKNYVYKAKYISLPSIISS